MQSKVNILGYLIFSFSYKSKIQDNDYNITV